MADVDLGAQAVSAGDSLLEQHERLFTTLYDELHRIAQRELHRNAAVTLSPTTLLHETFLNLSQREGAAFADRARFMAYAARAMRGLLIDYVRNRQAQKRGGEFEITSLATDLSHAADDDVELGAIGEALESLAKIEPQLAQCVDLRFFCGLSYSEIAALWSVSERTVRREWDKARILLGRLLDHQTVA
jgi:RNA polymerase sigma factor (TIGR02999 family)